MAGVTDIDYNRLLRWLLPVRLRKPKLIAWLSVVISPVRSFMYPMFKQWEQKSWYDIQYQTGQVQHLEYVLNDKMSYDPASPSIVIGPGNYPEHLYIPLRPEADPVYFGMKYIYRREDYIYGVYDFSIIVDIALEGTIDENYLKALANRYKRDGKTYTILYEAL